jgi:hypothetical protein
MAVWRPSTGTWYIIYSSDGSLHTQQWGEPGDIPVPGSGAAISGSGPAAASGTLSQLTAVLQQLPSATSASPQQIQTALSSLGTVNANLQLLLGKPAAPAPATSATLGDEASLSAAIDQWNAQLLAVSTQLTAEVQTMTAQASQTTEMQNTEMQNTMAATLNALLGLYLAGATA